MVNQMTFDEMMNDDKRCYAVIYYIENLFGETSDSKGIYIQADNVDMVSAEFHKAIPNPYAHITSIECMKSRINFYVEDKKDNSTRFLHTKYRLMKYYKDRGLKFKCVEEDVIIFEQRRKGVKTKR